MGKRGIVLVAAVGLALAGCGGPDVPAAEQGGSSVQASVAASVPVLPPSASAIGSPSAPGPSALGPSSLGPSAPTSVPRPSTPRPLPPIPATTAAPAPGPFTAQETAFLAQLNSLSAHVADGPAAVALGHKVCSQFGSHVAYDTIADSITGYNPDDARNLVTAAVLTLCPQHKSQVGG